MSASRVRPQSQAGTDKPPRTLDSSEGIEMENIQHQDPGLGGVAGTPSPPSRQAWSRDNPVFEPEEEIMQADWPQASPGRRSAFTASGGSSCSSGHGGYTRAGSSTQIPRGGGLYPTQTLNAQQQDRHEHPGCMKQILQKIRVLWGTELMEDGDSSRERYLWNVLRELLTYIVFLITICISNMMSSISRSENLIEMSMTTISESTVF